MPAVGEGDLHLSLFPLRSQHRHIPKFSLGADHGDPFLCHPLSRLGQWPVWGQAVAEQGAGLLFCHMDMPAGAFHFNKYISEDLFCHPMQIHPITP